MAFEVTPTRPLGKVWTLIMVVNTIIQWLKKEAQVDLDPEFVKTLVNVAVLDVAEFLSGAGSDDYGKTANLTDAAASVTTSFSKGSLYTNTTKTITKTSHGLTVSDIGKRIVYYNPANFNVDPPSGIMVITEIESITDANNFKVKIAAGIDITDVQYAVFSAHSTMNLDLSDYKIANITKLVDSINKEIVKVPDVKFDNLHRFSERQNKVFWYKHGQYIFLYKGTDVTNIGTITMYYNSYPQVFTDDNSLIDIKDNYVPLVIATAKNYCLEHLDMAPPESLTNLIDAKKKEIRENIQREKGIIDVKNKTTNG